MPKTMPIKMTSENWEKHKNATDCHICNKTASRIGSWTQSKCRMHICYSPAGRSVWGKTVTEVLKMLPEAAGLYGPTLSRTITWISFFLAVNWPTRGNNYFGLQTRDLETLRFDTYTILDRGNVDSFLQLLNNQQPSIRLTMETENDYKLAFLVTLYFDFNIHRVVITMAENYGLISDGEFDWIRK